MSGRGPNPIPPTCALPGTPLVAVAAGIDTCVHCGFCLQACPTYLTMEDENDSPRGRIVLMRALLDGTLPPDEPAVHRHIDRCLGCRGCETACPSGVPYGHLLEATRATLRQTRNPPSTARLVLWLFERRRLLALTLAGARLVRALRLARLLARLPGRAGFAFGMLDSSTPVMQGEEYIARDSPVPRERVAVLEGCVMRGLCGATNAATRRTLASNGYRLIEAEGQQCCGALHAHAGDLEAARRLARANIAAFERSGAERIAVNAAGCGAMMKEYAQLLSDDPEWSERAGQVASRVADASELLAAAGPRQGGELPMRVTYDSPCHLQHAQRIVDAPLRVLAAIPGLELVPLVDGDMCCGAAGIYNLVQPEASQSVLRPKLERIAETGADWVVTGNPGCLMQIGAGLLRTGARARVVHPIDLLDASYARLER